MILVVAALFVVTSLLVWQFAGYPLLMGLVALRAKPRPKNHQFSPFVSIIVPAYNERAVVGKRIENLLSLDYPPDKYEIIVVESGSTDGTDEIVEAAIEKRGNGHPELRLLSETERRGKPSAMNLGKSHARGEIVLVTDANAHFDPGVLKEMMPHFEDPKVGAVGGRYLVSNPDNLHTSSESFYWDLEYVMRRGEAALDSACLVHGEINAFRKDLVEEADTGIISEDLDTSIRIRRLGYKIEYEPGAMVYEPAATNAQEQISQRKRTTVGTLHCILKHRAYLFLPRDLYALFIFPSHKGITMLSPFLLMAIPVLYLLAWDLRVVVTHLGLTLLVFLPLLAALLMVRGRFIDHSGPATRIGIGSVPRIFYYVLLNEYLVLLAWIDFVRGRRTVLWEKVESTRTLAE